MVCRNFGIETSLYLPNLVNVRDHRSTLRVISFSSRGSSSLLPSYYYSKTDEEPVPMWQLVELHETKLKTAYSDEVVTLSRVVFAFNYFMSP